MFIMTNKLAKRINQCYSFYKTKTYEYIGYGNLIKRRKLGTNWDMWDIIKKDDNGKWYIEE